jgi:hypothetical protein
MKRWGAATCRHDLHALMVPNAPRFSRLVWLSAFNLKAEPQIINSNWTVKPPDSGQTQPERSLVRFTKSVR